MPRRPLPAASRARPPRALAAIAAVALLAGMAAAWPAAATAQVRVEAQLGFQQTLRLGRRAPLRVTVTNAGPARDGEVFARLPAGLTVEYVAPLSLPAGASRAASFAVPLPGTGRPIAVGFRDAAGRVLAERALSLADFRTTDALVLALTRDRDLEFLPGLLRRKTVVAYVGPDDLPVHWSGLDGVQAVVVHDVSLSGLDLPRYRALRRWIEMGGVLIFAGGGGYATLRGPREQSLLPVRVRGLTRVTEMPVLPNMPSQRLPGGEWLMVEAGPGPGRVLAAAEGHPLIARRDLGLGRVDFLAIDYAAGRLAGWSGAADLWALLLEPGREGVEVESLAGALELRAGNHPVVALLAQPLLHFPGRARMAGFVLAYGLLAWGALRLIGAGCLRRRAGWALLALLIVGATGLGWAWPREPLLQADAAVLALRTQTIHPAGDVSPVVEHVGLFAPRAGTRPLRLPNGEAVVRAVGSLGPPEKAASGPLRVTRAGGAMRWSGLHLPDHAAAVFTLEAPAPAPVALQVQAARGGATLTLHNRAGRPVVHSAVLHRGRYYDLGTLQPGERRQEDLFDVPVRPRETADPVARVLAAHLAEDWGDLGREVPRMLLHRHFRTRILAEVGDRTIWIGWVPGDRPGLALETGEAHEVSLTLLVAEVPL